MVQVFEESYRSPDSTHFLVRKGLGGVYVPASHRSPHAQYRLEAKIKEQTEGGCPSFAGEEEDRPFGQVVRKGGFYTGAINEQVDKRKYEWRTSITLAEQNRLLIRGYKIQDLIGNVTYPEVIRLLIKGELPPSSNRPS